MLQILEAFLSENFIPHGHCYLWKPSLVGLHILSDLLIALSYYSIPVMLLYFVRKRRDIPFNWIFLLFGGFIIACGTTHIMEVWTLWHPQYWLAGLLKAITALISFYTALIMLPLIPQALALPSPAQLEAANQALGKEIIERERVGQSLRRAQEELEMRVEERTAALKQEISDRRLAEEALRQSEACLKIQANQLQQTLQELQRTQSQLVQTEKMSSLGELVAGVAHEINNPINFIYGNLAYAEEYARNLFQLLHLYQQHYHQPHVEIQEKADVIDLDFIAEDFPKILLSMKLGTERIRKIVLSLRSFSRVDEAEMKFVDIHEGLDSTLLILQSRLKAKPEHPSIHVIRDYGNLPLVECYAGQLNQVFINLLSNAIDALDEYNDRVVSLAKESLAQDCTAALGSEELECRLSVISIHTEVLDCNRVLIGITDNGPGMSEEVRRKIFNPFFTTKPVGRGTGLGLSISYQIIVEKHGGELKCLSTPSQGTEFAIEIPIYQQVYQGQVMATANQKV